MKQSGKINFIIVSLCLFSIFSCTKKIFHAYSSDNIYIKKYQNEYFNDSLKVALQFYGTDVLCSDIKCIPPHYWKEIEDNKIKNLVFFNHTTINIDYCIYGYMDKVSDLEQWTMLLSEHKATYYRKSLHRELIFAVPCQKDYFLIIKSKHLNDVNEEENDEFLKEISEIMLSLKANQAYDKNYATKIEAFGGAQNALLTSQSNQMLNYIAPLKYLQQHKDYLNDTTISNNYYTQAKATFSGFLSAYDSVRMTLNIRRDLELNIADEAVKVIIDSAKNYNVLMINESHHDSRHRVLPILLLDSLKKIGYKYIAVEAMSYGDTLLTKHGIVSKNTGFYTLEPNFASFLTIAFEKGFKLVPYDDFNSSDREYSMARNIKQIFEKDPYAKVLVYAGYDHISEVIENEDFKPMAVHLKEMLRQEVLTVNQTKYCDLFYNSIKIQKSLAPNFYTVSEHSPNIILKNDIYVYNNFIKNPFLYDILPTNKQVLVPSVDDSSLVYIYRKKTIPNVVLSPFFVAYSAHIKGKRVYLPHIKEGYMMIIKNKKGEIVEKNNK